MALPGIDVKELDSVLLAATDWIDQAVIEWCLLDVLRSGLERLESSENEDERLQLEKIAWLSSELDERIGRQALPELKRLISKARGLLRQELY